jgi:hypothetical protein
MLTDCKESGVGTWLIDRALKNTDRLTAKFTPLSGTFCEDLRKSMIPLIHFSFKGLADFISPATRRAASSRL